MYGRVCITCHGEDAERQHSTAIDFARVSTFYLRGSHCSLPSRLKTPITVSHTFSTEVYFSILGEDAAGRPMGRPVAGGLRALKLTKAIILPGVS